MDFIKRAGRNITIGAFVGFVAGVVFAIFAIVVIYYKGHQPGQGWFLRGCWIAIFTAIFGAIMGLGCTKPTKQNILISTLLVASALVLSVAEVFIFCYYGSSDKSKIADAIGFALFGPLPLVGILCSIQQFTDKFSGKSAKSENGQNRKSVNICCKKTTIDKDKPINITDVDFDSEVLKSQIPVLVDFWAPWCGPCRMAGPVLEKIAKQYQGKLKVCKVNVDDQRQIAIDNGITSIPTLNFYKDGDLVGQMTGVTPHFEDDIKKKFEILNTMKNLLF